MMQIWRNGLCLEVAQGPQSLARALVLGAGACQCLPGTVWAYGRATYCPIQKVSDKLAIHWPDSFLQAEMVKSEQLWRQPEIHLVDTFGIFQRFLLDCISSMTELADVITQMVVSSILGIVQWGYWVSKMRQGRTCLLLWDVDTVAEMQIRRLTAVISVYKLM